MIQSLRICARIVPETVITSTGCRSVSTSAVCHGKRNFRKFPIINKRGVWEHEKLPTKIRNFLVGDNVVTTDQTKTRYPGVYFGDKFTYVKEMEPELIVPDNFELSPLKPYVSYKAEEIEQSAFTPEQLFNATYGKDIVLKHRANEEIPKTFTEYDEEAAKKATEEALKCGADLFDHTSTFGGIDNEYKYKSR